MATANCKEMIDPNTPGGRIAALRKKAGFSLARLGELVGVSPARVSNIEHTFEGLKLRPETVRRFAEALACKPEDIDPSYFATITVRQDVEGRYRLAAESAPLAEGLGAAELATPGQLAKFIQKAGKAGHAVRVLPAHAEEGAEE